MNEEFDRMVDIMDRVQKRIFDLLVSIGLILLFFPVFVIVFILVWLDLKQVLFKQERVGLRGTNFYIWKFRTRRSVSGISEAEVDFHNERLTEIGRVLRRFKLDELPQLFQVLIGQMSIIGPRPELSEYVIYHKELREKVLSVKPGLIDLAAVKYFDEDRMLQIQNDPKRFYTEVMLEDKMQMSLRTIKQSKFNRSLILLKYILKRKYH